MDLSSLLTNSGAKFRKEILAMPIASLEPVLRHMTLRQGVAGDETVGAIANGAQVKPYTTSKKAGDHSAIKARTLTTYLGDVIEEFDPYLLFSTVYGEQFEDKTVRTEAEIVKALSLAMAQSVSGNLRKQLFKAVRNSSGTTTHDLFNGFNAIAEAEISDNKISTSLGNLVDLEHLTVANVGTELKKLYDAAKEELQESANLKMFMPKAIKNLYDEWALAHFGAAVYNTSYNKSILFGTDEYPCELVGLSSLSNSRNIYLSTKENMLVGCDQKSNKEKVMIRVPDNPKVVQFFVCFFWGVQFQMIEPEFLCIGRQAYPTEDVPTASVTEQTVDSAIVGTVYEGVTASTEGAVKCAKADKTIVYLAGTAATGNAVSGKTYYSKDTTNKTTIEIDIYE